MFRIRNFGNDIDCADVATVRSSLERYVGKSVTVQDLRPGGRLFYLDVHQNGSITESYASQQAVNLELLLAQPGKPSYP